MSRKAFCRNHNSRNRGPKKGHNSIPQHGLWKVTNEIQAGTTSKGQPKSERSCEVIGWHLFQAGYDKLCHKVGREIASSGRIGRWRCIRRFVGWDPLRHFWSRWFEEEGPKLDTVVGAKHQRVDKLPLMRGSCIRPVLDLQAYSKKPIISAWRHTSSRKDQPAQPQGSDKKVCVCPQNRQVSLLLNIESLRKRLRQYPPRNHHFKPLPWPCQDAFGPWQPTKPLQIPWRSRTWSIALSW